MSRALNKIVEIFYPFKKYFQNMFVVFSGSAFSELIPIFLSPILTRIYSPEDFGKYGIIVSLAVLLGQFSTFRYENSIVISKSHQEIFAAWKFCEYLMFSTHLLYLMISFVIVTYMFGFFVDEKFFTWCLLIPLVSFSGAFFRIQVLLANREERFKSVFNSRMITTSLIAILGVFCGLNTYTSNGLIWALILGNLGGAFFLRSSRKTHSHIILKDLLNICKRYKNFPYYSLPADIIHNGAMRYPLIVFPLMMGNEIGGYLTLAYRVVGIPSRFVADAVGEIFFQYARKEMDSKKECLGLLLTTTLALSVIGSIGFVSLYLLSDFIFEVFFGNLWKPVGFYIKILTPLFLISFIVSPLSSMIYVSEKQNLDLLWKIGYFLMVLGSTFGSWFFFGDIETVLLYFVIAASGAYGIYFWIMFFLAKGTFKDKQNKAGMLNVRLEVEIS